MNRTVNQTVALGFGAVYALVGLLGFFVSDTFAATDDGKLLGIFEVNNLHNVVHLLIGVALLAASRRLDASKGANLAIGVTYVALAALGPFLTGTDFNIVALNAPDHLLHLASGVLLTAVAVGADKAARTRA